MSGACLLSKQMTLMLIRAPFWSRTSVLLGDAQIGISELSDISTSLTSVGAEIHYGGEEQTQPPIPVDRHG